MVEQTLREKKLWLHVMGTAVVPLAPRVVPTAIHEIIAADGAFIVAGAVEVTQVMADSELKKSKFFEAAVVDAILTEYKVRTGE